MGAPKQKWTTAEEAALRAGVRKHGLGKWRAIQKDPEFTFLLATRSNVDLKDKWRNMNIGVCGYGHREKPLKSLPKPKGMRGSEEPILPLPLAIIPGDFSADEAPGSSDSLEFSYAGMVIDAIMDLNNPNGASISEIASSIEANHLMPTNFRKTLRSKIKDMVKQGSLIKVKDTYKLRTSEESDEDTHRMVQVTGKRMRGIVRGKESECSNGRRIRDDSISDLTLRPSYRIRNNNTRGTEKAMLDVDLARLKLRTAEEAKQAAALAVAEAAAAAAAAEKAAKKARAAEVEAEAAEIVAEVAALAGRPPKKARRAALSVEEVAVTV